MYHLMYEQCNPMYTVNCHVDNIHIALLYRPPQHDAVEGVMPEYAIIMASSDITKGAVHIMHGAEV